jgi:tetratricopeptide (TPR) repeat protein
VRVDGGWVTFTHPLYASAVYGASATRLRRRMHRRLAELVVDPEERARHLAAATSTADERVARALDDAADLARARGAWGAATDLLEPAAALTPDADGDGARRRVLAAAQHHVHSGDRLRARALLEELIANVAPRRVRAEASCLLGEVSYNDENFDEARRHFAAAGELADDQPLTAEIELGLSYVDSSLMEFADARRHSHRALECAEAAGERSLLGQALANRVMMDFNTASGSTGTRSRGPSGSRTPRRWYRSSGARARSRGLCCC